MVIEPLINNCKALQNNTDVNKLRQKEDECRHQIFITVKVVNDAAPWSKFQIIHKPNWFPQFEY